MMNLFCHEVADKIKRSFLLCFIMMAGTIYVNGQQTSTVLPNNASYSNKSGPQGALRYQRGFYLITPAEMNRSGVTSGMNINSIGFTIGRAQNDTTQGRFKLYLQNTTDLVSRADTGWNTLNVSTNEYNAASLFPGRYEWQVKANCSGSSAFTSSVFFSNDELAGCNNPYNLNAVSVTSSAATLTWEAATSPSFVQYQVEYTALDVISWVSATTTDTFYNVSGLTAGKPYQWRVKTVCSATSSAVNYSTFTTDIVTGCNATTGLSSTVTQDSLVALSWTANATASFYEIQFRRTGTTPWSSTISVTNSANIILPAGTSYQWQVRISCAGGAKGPFTSSTFTTGGTAVCYDPIDPTTRQITSSSARLTWTPVVGATSYTLRYRLKNTISWTNAITPMQFVCDSMISIPDTIGGYDIPFHGGSPSSFAYTGGAVYVAWEYSRPVGVLSTSNLTLSTTSGTSIQGASGQDSITYLLSMISRADSSLPGLPDIIGETRLRPETRFGSAGLKDSVAVISVFALGMTTPKFQSPTPIAALITNRSATDKNYNVTLTVKSKQSGTVRYTASQNIAVTATDTALVSFSGWSPSLLEKDSIIVSIPAEPNENVINNNSKSYLQDVNASILAYDDGTGVVSAQGFGTAAGLLLNKHTMNGCGQVLAAKVYLAESAQGMPLYAVVRDTAGTIVAQSPSFTAGQGDINQYHSFYFTNPASFSNEDFYIGIAQQASATAYYPVGAQWEDETTRDSAYYRSNLDGTNLTNHPEGGRLMIRAELASSVPEPFISGSLILCSGGSNILTAGSASKRFANSVTGYSSQYGSADYSAAQALGSPDVYPAYALSTSTWVSSSAQGQREYLVLGFPNPGKINFVDIYETANPGAVDSVFVKNPVTLNFQLVYSATASAAPQAARKNHISFTETAFDVSEIRIALNSPAVPGYNAIDAVGIGKETLPGTFSTYLWSPGGETTQTKTVTAAGTYTLTVTNGSGCQSSDSVTVVDALSTPPTITPGGPLSICQGDSVKLTSSQASNNTWSTGATTRSIFVKTAGSYTVSYNDGSGCGVLTSAPVSVSVNPLPVVTITGTLGICPGGSTTLDAGAGYSSYLWSTGATSQTISVSSPGNYSVTVTNANGCKGSRSVQTFHSAVPQPAITGTLYFCTGSSTVLDAGSGYASYLWSPGGATTQTLAVTAPGNYSVTVTNNNGCSGSDSKFVSESAAPTPVISGSLSFCGGSFTTLDAGGGYTSYSWSNGATSQSILVYGPGTFTVTVTNVFGCTGSSSVTTSLTGAIPVTPGTISGPATANCNSTGNNYSIIAVPNTSHYVWTMPAGATLVSGQGTTSISVNFSASFQGGNIVVAASNACGQSPSIIPRQLFVQSLANTPGPITGQASGLCGPTTRTYSIAAVPMATSYTWSAPAGASIVSGQGTTSVTVSFTAGFNFGDICVTANNSCGSTVPSCMMLTGISPTPGAISGPTTVCKNQSNIPYSIAAVPGATSYTWTVPQAAQITAGQGTTNIVVKMGPQSGNITVRANSACGSSAVRSLAITVNNCTNAPIGNYTMTELRPVPEIVSNYGGSAKAGDLYFEWTLGEPRVETIIKPDYLFTQGFHQPLVYIIPVKQTDTAVLVVSDQIKVAVYPNPVSTVLKVKVETPDGRPLVLELMDVYSHLLQRKNIAAGLNKNLVEIKMSGYVGGSYYLVVRDTDGKIINTVKLVKVD